VKENGGQKFMTRRGILMSYLKTRLESRCKHIFIGSTVLFLYIFLSVGLGSAYAFVQHPADPGDKYVYAFNLYEKTDVPLFAREASKKYGRQCVEYVKRFYYYKMGYSKNDGNVIDANSWSGDAWRYWDTYAAKKLLRFANRGNEPPRAGDIIVYNRTQKNSAGHVVIVTSIVGNRVNVIQQNYPWKKASTGSLTMTVKNNTYNIPISNLLGWLRGKNQPSQPNPSNISIGEGAPDQNSRAAFVHAYENHGGKPKAGCPTNKVHHWGNGWVQDFKGGSVDSAAIMLADGASTAYVVWGGSIWQKYISLRGAEGPLGYPTSDEIPVTASTGTQGVYQEFKDGRLTWHRNGAFPNKTFATYGAILAKYKAIGGPSHPIGLPIADEGEALRSPFGTTGTYSRFERGTINWHRDGSRAKQTFFVMGGIFEKYKAMGYSSSWLGFPISDEYDVTGGARSDFEGGNISWTPQGGMVAQPNDKPSPITDEIYNVWRNGDQAQNRYGTAAQSFKATLPFIKSVAFNAATWLNNAPGGKVHVKIFSDEAQTKLVGTYKETAVNNYGETTVTWDKPMPVNVGSTYWLQLLPVKGTKLLVYFSKYDDYSEGVLYLNWAREQSFDLNAKIKGLSKADS